MDYGELDSEMQKTIENLGDAQEDLLVVDSPIASNKPSNKDINHNSQMFINFPKVLCYVEGRTPENGESRGAKSPLFGVASMASQHQAENLSRVEDGSVFG